MKTIALYDEDAFAKSFTGKVISCEEIILNDDKLYKVVLDKTLFFPEQGGQSSDIGTLDEHFVINVQIEDDTIYHYCKSGFLIGEEVQGKIDWAHRFSNMQQHTGEHIFTGLPHNEYGADNVGFHLSDNTVTLDLNIELSAEQVEHLERRANEIVAADLAIKAYYPNQDLLGAIAYRSKKEIEGPVRLVEIEGVDLCACCAPHVKTTGQVGMLKVVSFGRYKGGTRIYILCGMRALEDYNRRMKLLEKSYQVLSCKEDEVPDKIRALLDEEKQLKYRINEIKSGILMDQIESYPSEIADITIFSEDLDSKIMRDGVNALVEKHEGLCSIFSGNDEDGYNFVIGSKTRDCAAIAAGMRELLGAKGGGSKQMAQGSVNATRNALEQTL